MGILGAKGNECSPGLSAPVEFFCFFFNFFLEKKKKKKTPPTGIEPGDKMAKARPFSGKDLRTNPHSGFSFG